MLSEILGAGSHGTEMSVSKPTIVGLRTPQQPFLKSYIGILSEYATL
jgi:hypothetical protein